MTRDLGGLEVGGGFGDVDLNDDPAVEGVRQRVDGADQVDVATTGFGPDREGDPGGVMVVGAGRVGSLGLVEVDVLQMHGCDAVGVVTHQGDRIHSGPAQVPGIGPEAEDGGGDAVEDGADLGFDFDPAADVGVQAGPDALGGDGFGCRSEAVDDSGERRWVLPGSDGGLGDPQLGEIVGDEDLGVAERGLYGGVPLGGFDDLGGVVVGEVPAEVAGRRAEAELRQQVGVAGRIEVGGGRRGCR